MALGLGLAAEAAERVIMLQVDRRTFRKVNGMCHPIEQMFSQSALLTGSRAPDLGEQAH